MTLRHLAEAEDHAVLCEHHLGQQLAVVERLTRDGREAGGAVALLATLQDTQRLHLEHRYRQLKELFGGGES